MTRIEKLCADKGLRMTDQHRVIARVLSDAIDHPDAEELYRRAAAIPIRTSPSPRSIAPSSCSRMPASWRRHDFATAVPAMRKCRKIIMTIIDVQTGSVIEFRNEDIEKLQRHVAEELGFGLIDHRLELYGVPKAKRLS